MEKIYFKSDDATLQSHLVAAVALVKYPSAELIDTAGLDESGMGALISALTNDTVADIVITTPVADSHVEGKFTTSQAIDFIAKLTPANDGTDFTGTCQANATKTNIILAAAVSQDDDYFNGCLIRTAGTTAINRLITDYTGSSDTCVVADTGTAITTTETYTVYKDPHLYLWGSANGGLTASENALDLAFTAAKQEPLILDFFSADYFIKYDLTATSVASGSLSDTGEFTAGAYDGKDFYVSIMSATTGAGQTRLIASNTTGTLTLDEDWDVTPTGTVKYQITQGSKYALYDIYLKYGMLTYLSGTTPDVISGLKNLIDRYGDFLDGNASSYQDLAYMDEIAEKGKIIATAKFLGVVS